MELHEDPFFRAVVTQKAKLLIAMRIVVESDREDIEQTLYCDLLSAMKRFDPNRGHRNVYITVVLDRTVADIVRRHRANKRSGKPASLSTLVYSDDEIVELSQCITLDDLKRRFGSLPITAQQRAELRRDIQTAIENLPLPVQRLAKLLKTYNATESAKRMGVPRTALYVRVAQLRAAMDKVGLKKYLQK